MENWITILRSIASIVSVAAGTVTLISNLVRLRRDAGAPRSARKGKK
jgi:hypothetical protein